MEVNLEDVKEFIPHRDPFLFVDSIEKITVDFDPATKEEVTAKDIIGGTVIGHYRTRADHTIFKGHFPGNPIFPGVVQIDMMAQVSSFALMKLHPNWRNLQMNVMLLGVTSSKFRKPIYPDMDLRIETICDKVRGPFMTNSCKVFCNGELMSEATTLASVQFEEKK